MSGSDAIIVSSLLCLALCLDNTLMKAALAGRGDIWLCCSKKSKLMAFMWVHMGLNRIKHGTSDRVCVCFVLNVNE